MSDTVSPQWFCIHTKPKSEHLAAANLSLFDEIETYCPRIKFKRSTPRGKVWFTEALFPGYIFARFDLSVWRHFVKNSAHVIGIVGFGDVPVAVPDQIVEDVRSEMRGQELRELSHDLQIGDTMEVVLGPKRVLRGIMDGPASQEERVKVLLELLGHRSLVELAAFKMPSDSGPPPQEGSGLKILLDPGDAPMSVLLEVLSAISELNRALGGDGLVFVDEGKNTKRFSVAVA